MLDRRHFLMSAGALALAGGATAKQELAPPPAPIAAAAPPPQLAPSPQSASQQLSKLLDDFFQEQLVESPELATVLGLDTGAHADQGQALRRLVRRRRPAQALNADQLRRLKAIDRKSLSGMAAVNYDTVLYDLETTDRRERPVRLWRHGAVALCAQPDHRRLSGRRRTSWTASTPSRPAPTARPTSPAWRPSPG